MARSRFILWMLALLFLGFSPVSRSEGAVKPHEKTTNYNQARQSTTQVSERYDRAPVSFEANEGQTDSQVKFLARGLGYSLFLTSDELVISIQNPSHDSNRGSEVKPDILRVKFLGAKVGARISGTGKLSGTSNYFVGNNPRQWRTRIPTYAGVRYENIYPGVDLVVHGNGHKLEYDFVIAPGAITDAARLQIQGADRIQLDSEGNLSLQINHQQIKFLKPQASQQICDQGLDCKRPVSVHYDLVAKDEVSFQAGTFDHSKPLLIDPVLDYSTFLGGSGGDVANGIAVSASGNAYVVGFTGSSNFPTLNPHQSTGGGGQDVFISKFDPNGGSLIYSTYLGGSGNDFGAAIAIDSSGDAYITGSTTSANFPIASTASTVFQPSYGGNGDAFVAELDSSGSTLLYSSFLGGGSADSGQAIAVDASGHAYVAGSTQSSDFPKVGPFQASNAGASDAFVAEVKADGSALIYSTYLGGDSADSAQGIALDSSGDAYVTGVTFSSNFPTANAIFPSNHGSADAFVTELNPTGAALVFSTYLGGSGLDQGFGIALDGSNNIYVVGDTQSTDLPTASGTFQPSNHGNGDGFVAKLNAGGTALGYISYLGGSGTDRATAIAVTTGGNAYITGYTLSNDFPTSQPLQPNQGGGSCGGANCADAFVTELDTQGSSIVYSTYLGGNGADFGQSIALGPSGNPYVAGSTASSNFPAIAGAFQAVYSGTSSTSNAFVAKVDSANVPGLAMSPQAINFGNQGLNVTSAPVTVTVTNAGSSPLTISIITPPSGGPFAETDNCVGNTIPSGGTCSINVTFRPTATGASTDKISIDDNAPGSPHSIAVTGTGVAAVKTVTLSPATLAFADQTVGTTSGPKTFTVTNNGPGVLTITSISASGNFAQTNTCGTSLAEGASCTVTVTFTPTATGARSGGVNIADDASGSPQATSLTGTGDAVYALTSAANSSTLLIGSASTTFTVLASGPSSFSENITLGCTGAATCSFNPASIKVGESSTVTVSGLSTPTANPYNFTVTGTSSTTAQATSVPLTILFSDFSVSASPPLDTITSGGSATYTVKVTPINGFNQSVKLSCIGGAPQGAACSFSPSSLQPDGSGALTSTLTITTAAASASPPPSGKWPKFPGGSTIPLVAVISWLSLVMLAAWKVRRSPPPVGAPSRNRIRFAIGTLFGTVLLATLLAACGGSTTLITPTGSQRGNYTIVIQGVLGSNNSVVRNTTVNLTVD